MPATRFIVVILLLLNLLAFAAIQGWLGGSRPRGEPERLSNQLNPQAIVIGSTAAIIPSGVSGIRVILTCALLFLVGAAASYGLAKLDEKHPHESLF